MSTVLGIDLGTQSIKVVFYDYLAQRVIAMESAPLDLYQDETGAAEQQVHWWTNALHEALNKVGSNILKTAEAIGVSGQQHGFVALDHAGSPLVPVKLWCDTSSQAECHEIMDAMGGSEACMHATGNLILPGYTASKVLWLRKNYPALYNQLHTILLPHDYINYYLTGEACMEMGDASGTGFLNIRKRRWSQSVLSAIDPDRDLLACLPKLRTSNQAIGTLSPQIAAKTGLPAGIPVSIGGGDNMMGAIGGGNVSPGKVSISLGTSGTVYAFSDTPIVDPAGSIAAFCSSTGGWLPLLCTMNCTVSTELMRGLLNASITEFEALLEQSQQGAGGVITLPFFNGERTPNMPSAKGCIIGLDSRNSKPENLLRSAVEGATFALRYGIDALRHLGIRTDEIILTGGGAKSATWRQVVADICGAPVAVLKQSEGAAMGAALQALAILPGAGDLGEIVNQHLTRDEPACRQPSDSSVNFYTDLYQSYTRAVDFAADIYT